MDSQINLKPSKQFWCALIIIILTIFLVLAGYKANAQEIQNYYTTQVRIYYSDGTTINNVWYMNHKFDEINNHLYFNIRPNNTEEFTIVHKVYTAEDSFDKKERLKKTEYILDDKARFFVIPAYDDPDIYILPTGCYYKLVETMPYSVMRHDINRVEFLYYTDFIY